MIAPSISFDDAQVKPLWAGLTLADVEEMIRCDVDELDRLYKEQSEAAKIESTSHRQVEEIRLRGLIQGWENAQDAHWSWYREIANDRTRSTERPPTVGPGLVGQGY